MKHLLCVYFSIVVCTIIFLNGINPSN